MSLVDGNHRYPIKNDLKNLSFRKQILENKSSYTTGFDAYEDFSVFVEAKKQKSVQYDPQAEFNYFKKSRVKGRRYKFINILMILISTLGRNRHRGV